MRNNKPSLLFFVTEDWYFCSHRLPIAIAAKEVGWDVTIVTRISDKKDILEKYGLNVISLNVDRSGTNPLKEAVKIWEVYRVFRRERPDLVHLVALKPVVIGGLAARLAGVKNVVAAVAGMGFLFAGNGRSGFVQKIILKIISIIAKKGKIIVQNQDDRWMLTEAGISSSRIHLIRGAGVDTTLFNYMDEPEGIPIVMLASRLLREKGVGEFAEAARILKSRNVNARFVLVGTPDTANPGAVPEKEIMDWEAEGIIEWWGKKDDMPAILSMAAVVCLPSYREGLPKVLLEAMACGRPCITTDTPGCREAVQHGKNGLLVPVRDPQKLGTAINQLLSDPELRKQMGSAGRQMAEKEFSQEIVMEQTMAIYRDMLRNSYAGI